ncbi:hypothetical protein [Zoogloea sp.]|uniref:hypothetical protein n=1 Tax=Zoogloea sp. TaxID=49181 RepID=UPI00261B3A14|nr:hypothetical protein [Zoogloea sp.]MDD3352182.1 hypothetical protein [Zoogloea sp.]
MLRRLLTLLLLVLLPLQAVAGMAAPLCRHGMSEARAEPVHCHEETVSVSVDAGLPDVAAHQEMFCDGCGACHHVAFSLLAVPDLAPLVSFSPVRVASPLAPLPSRVPAQPERPPRLAAA